MFSAAVSIRLTRLKPRGPTRAEAHQTQRTLLWGGECRGAQSSSKPRVNTTVAMFTSIRLVGTFFVRIPEQVFKG